MLDSIVTAFFAIVLAFVVYALVYVGVYEYNKPACLENGYGSVEVTYSFDAYCITTIEQTEVVTPIGELIKK